MATDLDGAFEACRLETAEWAKTFYLGTLLLPPEKRRAIWAIYVWCRRTDELVDGPNASHITPEALDRWEERLENIFAGKPMDVIDAADYCGGKSKPENEECACKARTSHGGPPLCRRCRVRTDGGFCKHTADGAVLRARCAVSTLGYWLCVV